MRKLGERRTSRSCREIKEANRDKLQDTLKGAPPKIPASGVPVITHYGRSLHKILLALGYEASLVEMLGQKYGG
ncbi:MAG TPA: hypothetical protein VEG68_17590 [Terriglobales bacterium]|nr:hypothetical protein [Terriglobales bacterium]